MPNMWHSDGRPCVDEYETEGEYQARTQYQGTPEWTFHRPWKGYRGHLPTAEEDFATPFVDGAEDPDGWDLI